MPAAGEPLTQPFFDRWSSTYDRPALQLLTYRPIHDAILGRLDGSDPSTVLDLGCGTGQLTRRLIDRFPNALVLGADLSAGMLAEAASRVGDDPRQSIGLIRADAQRLPIRGDSVDVIVCTESFHWYPDQRGALEGLARVLRPGGQFFIASIATTTDVGDNALRRVSRLQGQQIWALPPRRLRRLLRQSGFEVVHQRRIPRLGLIPWPVLTQSVLRS